MNLGQLKTTVRDYLNRSDLDNIIPTFIEAAALKIQRKFRLLCSQKTMVHTFVDGEEALSPPLDFGSFYQAWVFDGSEKLYRPTFVSKSKFDRAIISSDTDSVLIQPGGFWLAKKEISDCPVVLCFWSNLLLLYPKVSGAGVGKKLVVDYFTTIQYTQKPDTHVDDLIIYGWDALVYGAMLEARPYLGDARVAHWLGLYTEALQGLHVRSVALDFGETSLSLGG